MFVKVFPEYLAMGMTYDEFWRGPSMLARAYRKAYQTRMRNEEWARWRQGAYFFNALMCAAPVMRTTFGKGRVEPGKYPMEPWPLTEKEAEERQEAADKARMMKFIAGLRADEKRRKAKEAGKDADH